MSLAITFNPSDVTTFSTFSLSLVTYKDNIFTVRPRGMESNMSWMFGDVASDGGGDPNLVLPY